MEKRILKPNEMAHAARKTGKKKAEQTAKESTILGILAGIFIAFGSVGATILWGLAELPALGKFLGAAIFPVGIILVVLAGSQLFTGNNLMTLGYFKGDYGFKAMLKNWTFVYLGNFIGSIFMAYLIYQSHLWIGNAIGAKAIAIAEKKVASGFNAAMIKGILCNMIVVLSVWLSISATDATGKVFTLWFPITLFAMSGYEHIVANMFFIPVGIFHGANITWSAMVTNNFIPVTIGNIIGGAIIIPVLYHLLHGQEK